MKLRTLNTKVRTVKVRPLRERRFGFEKRSRKDLQYKSIQQSEFEIPNCS